MRSSWSDRALVISIYYGVQLLIILGGQPYSWTNILGTGDQKSEVHVGGMGQQYKHWRPTGGGTTAGDRRASAKEQGRGDWTEDQAKYT